MNLLGICKPQRSNLLVQHLNPFSQNPQNAIPFPPARRADCHRTPFQFPFLHPPATPVPHQTPETRPTPIRTSPDSTNAVVTEPRRMVTGRATRWRKERLFGWYKLFEGAKSKHGRRRWTLSNVGGCCCCCFFWFFVQWLCGGQAILVRPFRRLEMQSGASAGRAERPGVETAGSATRSSRRGFVLRCCVRRTGRPTRRVRGSVLVPSGGGGLAVRR